MSPRQIHTEKDRKREIKRWIGRTMMEGERIRGTETKRQRDRNSEPERRHSGRDTGTKVKRKSYIWSSVRTFWA